jgi:hypothetical protein
LREAGKQFVVIAQAVGRRISLAALLRTVDGDPPPDRRNCLKVRQFEDSEPI